MAGISEGDYLLLCYAVPGPALYHVRRVMGLSAYPGWFVVLTPDFDFYVEECDPRNPDLQDIRMLGRARDGSAGLAGAQLNQFAGDPAAEAGFSQWQADCRLLAHTFVPPGAPVLPVHMGAAAGAGPPGAPAPAPAPAGPAPLTDVAGEIWVYAEDGTGFQKGDAVGGHAGALGFDDRGVLRLAGGHTAFIRRIPTGTAGDFKCLDLRILPVVFDGQGERKRTWAGAVEDMNDEEPEGGLLGVTAPRTALWNCKDIAENGGNPKAHVEWWARHSKIPEGDRSSYEMEVLGAVVYAMGCIDQLNLPALTSAELIFRRMALIKEAHRLSPSSPDYSASDYFMGWSGRRGWRHNSTSTLSSCV